MDASYFKYFNVADLDEYKIIRIFEIKEQNLYSALVVPDNETIESARLYTVDGQTNKRGFVDGAIANSIIESSNEVWVHPNAR